MTRAFTVLMPLSRGEQPSHLRTALRSVFEQTSLPDELLIVQEPELPETLELTVEEFRERHPDVIKTIVQRGGGLGDALRLGVESASNDLIARMDSDDISVPDRFERQLHVLDEELSIDLIGGYTAEFTRDPDEIYALGTVPSDPNSIAERARHRNPINHPTAMFRRNAVISAGNYRTVHGMEDYDLWVRMLMCGHVLANIPDVLVKYRVDEGYNNRGGLEVVQQELRLQCDFLRSGFIDPLTFARNLTTRVPVRLLPEAVRDEVITRVIRKPVGEENVPRQTT